jgi:hypothetical protein
MPIQITCPNPVCLRQLQTREEFAGKSVACPACHQVIRVPAFTSQEEEPINLAVPVECATGAVPETLSGPQSCTSCNAPMPSNAVLCVSCGFNRKTGKKLSTVRVRQAKAVIQMSAAKAVALSFYGLGGLFAFPFLHVILAGELLSALVILPLGTGFILFAYFFDRTTVAKVTVSSTRKGKVTCNVVYESFHIPYRQRKFHLSPDDRLVLCHEVRTQAIIITVVLLCLGFFPGVIWWLVILRKCTFLEIRCAEKGRVIQFSTHWGEDALRHLIDAIREVEYLPIERG